MSNRAVIFGAGNIGRGLVAPVLQRAGYQITFVDADTELISRLDSAKAFNVQLDDGSTQAVSVHAAIEAQQESAVVEAVAEADLIATAVGGAILPIVAGPIAAGLSQNSATSVNVIACENTHPNSELLAELVGETRAGVGFPEVVVDRVVIPADGVDVSAEAGFEFFVDGTAWTGDEPPEGIDLVDDIHAYVTRKLWLVNGLHAVAAFQALGAGHEFVSEAMQNDAIEADVEQVADNMLKALVVRHPSLDPEDLRATADGALARFRSDAIQDPVVRVARNPLPKLAKEERILGPALAAQELNLPLQAHARTIAAALASAENTLVAGSENLQSALHEKGWEALMQEQGATEEVMEATEAEMDSADEGNSATITILNPSGLHARPASQIVENVKASGATVKITKGDKQANAASILSVLALGASTGDEVTITAEGEGAAEAMAFVQSVLLDEEGE